MRKSLLFLLPLSLSLASADVTLPPLISDNMVLQRTKAAIWGKADPGERVSVKLGAIGAKATAGKDGSWSVKLEGLKVGEPGELVVSGKNKLTVKNVAVGDVWICSGQSNMEMTVLSGTWCGYGGVLNAGQEVAMADSPTIRMFTVTKKSPETPMAEVEGQWEVCSPETVVHWSATGYFFARQLHDDLDIPVGMINSSVGGSSAQAWTPTEVLQGDPELKTAYYDRWKTQVAEYPAAKEVYEKTTLPAWQAAADQATAAGQPVPRKPSPPLGAPGSPGFPSAHFNGMIYGASKFPIKGAVWYQGESNSREPALYQKLLSSMIGSWRKAWGVGDFPFLIVQLASFTQVRPEPADSLWAELRDAQKATAEAVPNAGLAVAIDIGDAANIHPKNKQEVGRRLALVAEAKVYGKNVVASGPMFAGAQFDAGTAKIAFKPGTAIGLTTKDGGDLKGFAVAGEDQKFVWAQARIVGADPADHSDTLTLPKPAKGKKGSKAAATPAPEPTIVVSSPSVPKPIAVRYAWAQNPEVNLVNKAGLPGCPFRTDTWPQNPPPPMATPPSTVAPPPMTTPRPAAAASPIATPAPTSTPAPTPVASTGPLPPPAAN